MNLKFTEQALTAAKAIQKDADELWLPPAEIVPHRGEMVLLHSITKGTRGYVERVVYQINGTYENGWYDACAVMIRRLIETLIIEAFEHNNIADKIKAPNNEFLPLSDLITCTLNEPRWNLSRNSKALQALANAKGIGDRSAHNRRYNAHRGDIDQIKFDLRVIVQELIYLAGLK